MKNRIIALMLVLAFLVQALPLQVFAEQQGGSTEPEQEEFPSSTYPDIEEDETPAVPVVIGELSERRGETEKHFRMDDGSFIAVDYGLPVHFSEDGGETWEDIDNTLVLTETPSEAEAIAGMSGMAAHGMDGGSPVTDEAPVYIAQNGDNTHSFAQTLGTGFLFSAENEGYGLRMFLADPGIGSGTSTAAIRNNSNRNNLTTAENFNRNAAAEITYPDARTKKETDSSAALGMTGRAAASSKGTDSSAALGMTSTGAEAEAEAEAEEVPDLAEQVTPSKLRADVLYRDVYDGVDLSYTLYSWNIKETILVNRARDSYVFPFYMDLGNLNPVLTEDRSVELRDSMGEIVYLIPAPYMTDAAGAYSDAVSYSLTQTEANTWQLTVTADGDWINDESRAFPVAIDPTLIDAIKNAEGVLKRCVADGGDPEDYIQKANLVCGNHETYGQTEIFFKFKNPPEIPDRSELVHASISFYQNDFRPQQGNNVGSITLSVQPCLSGISSYSNLTWDDRPQCGSTLDYVVSSYETINHWLDWDVTRAAQQWYLSSANNHGLAMTSNATSSNHRRAWFTYALIYLIVSYRDTTGIEPYYTYQTMGVDRAGTAYVSDYTGALTTVTPLVSYASTINPFSLNLIYSSSYFRKSSAAEADIPQQMGYGFHMGNGMKLNVMQTVELVHLQNEATSENTTEYLKYTDGDGTAHYFAKDLSKDPEGKFYFDEDGLGLKAEKTTSTNYHITDDKGNDMLFCNGFLTQIKDANQNRIQIWFAEDNGSEGTYWYPTGSGDRIDHIVQKNNGGSKITVATFSYDTVNGRANTLRSITDAAGMVYTFRYSGKRTSTIRRNTQNAATEPVYIQFDYSSTEGSNRLVQLTDVKSGYSVMATYSGGRVATLKEHSSEASGMGVTISRVIGEKTVYTDWGNDRIYGTDDDISTVYLFDNVGRTVNAYTSDASGKVLGASNAAYSETTGTNKKNNRTTRTAAIGMAGMNLILNGSFEKNDSSWSTIIPSNTENTVYRSQEMPRTGNWSLRTRAHSSSDSITGASHVTEQLKNGETYTFSVYINTSAAGGFSSDSSKGAYLKITKPSGNEIRSESVNYVTNSAIDGGWVRISRTFTAAATGVYTVTLCNEGIWGGPVYFDDLQVEENDTFSSVNLLENGGGTVSGECWQTQSGDDATSISTVHCPAATYYGRSMKINGDPNENRWVEQTVTVNQPGTQTYVFSGWAKADAVPGEPEAVFGDPVSGIKHTKQFGLRAILTYEDNTQEYHYAPFNPDVTEWQYNSLTIVPKKTGTDVSTIRVLCVYEKNANAAYFGNLSLVREVAQVMDYNNDGQLISVNSTDHAEQQYIYDGDKNLQKVTIGQQNTPNTPGYREYNYTYDGAHNVLTASDGAVKQTNTYTDDEHTTVNGNVYSTKLTSVNGGSSSNGIHSKTSYANSGNLVSSVTDARKKTTSYQYLENLNKMLGLPAKVTLPEKEVYPSSSTAPVSTVIQTSYLDDGRVSLSKINNTVQISRVYGDNEFLTGLSRLGYNGTTGITQDYNFTYNSFGSTTSIKVGTQELAHYTYGLRNGLLTGMTYGNGDTVSYTYDNLGRKTQATTSSGDSYTYAYTGDGQLYEMQDTAGSLLYRYTYDTIGRLISSSMKANGTVKLQTQHQYDNQNRLASQTFALPGRTYGESFTYDGQNKLTGKVLSHPGGTSTISLIYDYLGRLGSVTTPASVTSYSYSNYTEDDVLHASNYVSSMLVTPVHAASELDAFKLKYSYDGEGNITYVRQYDTSDPENLQSTVHYKYDKQNQLTYESSTAIGTWNYRYDTFGNLRTKEHSRNNSTDESWTYTYGDEIWADKLTGLSITTTTNSGSTTVSGSYTYDNSGNPTSYFSPKDLTTWTMTWKNGRELATASNGTHSVSYDYDVNGLRTYKIVDGVRHDYIYASGLLLQESYSIQEGGVTDTYVLDFQYDQNGRPYVLNYTKNGTTFRYYYILNLQGDVLYLVSAATGVTYAAYTYDAWGNILTSSGTMAGRNPLRYRGYYYDSETGFYYLQSRYYDPALGRFINADSYASTGQGFLGCNMFAYCNNTLNAAIDYNGCYPVYQDVNGNTIVDNRNQIKYDVPLYDQGNYSLCWAFCEVMDYSYRTGLVFSQSAAEKLAKTYSVIYHFNYVQPQLSFKKSNWNRGGVPLNYGTPIEDVNRIEDLYFALVQNGGPLYATYRRVDKEGKKHYHMVLVVGADCRADIVYTNNPWNRFGAQSFSAFQAGFVGSEVLEEPYPIVAICSTIH